MADNSTEIAKLERLVNGGVKKTVIDGVVTERDIAVAQSRLRQLKLTDDTQKTKRPFAASIDLSGF